MNFLWTKRIIKRSKISSMQKKCHCRYYVNFLISVYLPFNRKIHTCDRWNKNVIDVFLDFLNQNISNISNIYNPNVNPSLESQKKCDNMFSYPLVGSYIFTFFSIFQLLTWFIYKFLLVCGNYWLTYERGRCRNLLWVDSLLNHVNPSMNIISFTIQMRIQEKN